MVQFRVNPGIRSSKIFNRGMNGARIVAHARLPCVPIRVNPQGNTSTDSFPFSSCAQSFSGGSTSVQSLRTRNISLGHSVRRTDGSHSIGTRIEVRRSLLSRITGENQMSFPSIHTDASGHRKRHSWGAAIKARGLRNTHIGQRDNIGCTGISYRCNLASPR